jgi:hypothetical protein
VWLAATPFLAAGVLVAHVCAYRVTGTPTGPAHAYLGHAPQVLAVLAVVAAALAAFTSRRRQPALWAFPLAGLGAFALQEHVEGLAHTGELPLVVTSPAFAVGLLLQFPFGLAAWLLARMLLSSLDETERRRPRLPRPLLVVVLPALPDVRTVPIGPLPGRGPPPLLRR